jgi:tetratricopeptide (TPR) repeat protein
MDLPPEPKVLALAEELRSPSAVGPKPSAIGATPSAIGHPPSVTPPRTEPPVGAMRYRLLAISVVVLLLLRFMPEGWRRWISGGEETGPRLVAVTGFQDFAGDSLTGPLAELLRTSLANIPGLGVISGERMAEGRARAGTDGPLAVAREAGASEVLNGALYRRNDGSLRFDLRRVDPVDGRVLEAIEVDGEDVFRLTALATRRLVERYGVPSPEGEVTRVSSSSLTAIRLYQAGMDAYIGADPAAAYDLFDRAAGEDTAFAMAEFYAAWVAPNDSLRNARLERAHRLAGGASLRERLIIDMHRGDWNSAPNTLALAESLTTLFPQEIAGHFQLGRSRLYHAGDFLGAERAFRAALRLDTVGFTAHGKRCDACAARSGIITSWMFADSFPAARREAEGWARAYPTDPTAWRFLTMVVSLMGDSAAAARALVRVAELDDLVDEKQVGSAFYSALYLGQVDRADSILRAQLAAGPRSRRADLHWMLAHLRREQGRPRAAAAAMLEWRRLMGPTLPVDANFQGQVLFEAGEVPRAARLWDSIGRIRTAHPSRQARGWTWSHTLQSLALAALGDTARLLPIADSMKRISLGSGFTRDRRLHHHVEGLYWMARGDDVKALAEFRESVWSYTAGYTQTDLLIARSLLRLGQAREAARVCGSGLHAEMAASAQYVSRGEFHECAGRAWLAAGEPDSARAHLQTVVAQWKGAEPPVAARRDSLQALLTGLRE